jgi:hypothetical protein
MEVDDEEAISCEAGAAAAATDREDDGAAALDGGTEERCRAGREWSTVGGGCAYIAAYTCQIGRAQTSSPRASPRNPTNVETATAAITSRFTTLYTCCFFNCGL